MVRVHTRARALAPPFTRVAPTARHRHAACHCAPQIPDPHAHHRLQHTSRARKYSSTGVHDTYGNSRAKRLLGMGTRGMHGLAVLSRAPEVAEHRVRRARALRRRRLVLEDFGRTDSLLRAGASASSPGVPAAPAAPQLHGHIDTFTGRMSSCWPFQIMPPAARSAAEAVSRVPKMGVVSHGLAGSLELPRTIRLIRPLR